MWTLPMQKIEFVTVNQMYKLSQLRNQPLLSDYTAEFWNEYLQNFARYDRVFNRLYRNFYYFNQEANSTAELVQPEFTEDVYGLLLMNHKKYSELYRIHVVDDDTYSILDNYDVTETREGEMARTITDSFGQKIQNILGSNDLTDMYGQKTDSLQESKGLTDAYGQKIESLQESKDLTDVYGQKVTTGQSVTGSQDNTAIDKVAPYDSENFANETRNETNLGQRSDTATTTENTYTDTHDTSSESTSTRSAYSDTHNTTTSSTNTRGSYTDTHNTDIDTTVTDNAHEDTHEHEGTDSYTLRRKGNIGVQTQTEVIEKHARFWRGFSFYKIIFDDICKELLLIEKGYLD